MSLLKSFLPLALKVNKLRDKIRECEKPEGEPRYLLAEKDHAEEQADCSLQVFYFISMLFFSLKGL